MGKLDTIKFIEDEFVKMKTIPDFSAGDNITVTYTIKEGEKVRLQKFTGTVIQRKGTSTRSTFTVRKMTSGIGIERIFPVSSPIIEEIVVNKRGSVRRARIFYLRALTGKKTRIKERKVN